jgi:hypothetical protein
MARWFLPFLLVWSLAHAATGLLLENARLVDPSTQRIIETDLLRNLS